jgi:hypothetical protein
LAKSIFRGKAHQIKGNIFFGSSKKPIFNLKGEWNSQIYIKKEVDKNYKLFTNVVVKDDVNKVFKNIF